MLIFVDDSGDPGFKLGKGSSPVFIICCVIFDDELEAEKAAIKIKELRRELGRSDQFEFKFNKCGKTFRLKFLGSVAPLNFRVRAIVMTKPLIYSEELRSSKQSFYNYAIKTVLKHNAGSINNARIRLDGRADKNFKRELSHYLQKSLNDADNHIIANVRFRDSKKDVLIQLADMIAGALHRTHQIDKQDSEIYWRAIKRRAEDIWEFK